MAVTDGTLIHGSNKAVHAAVERFTRLQLAEAHLREALVLLNQQPTALSATRIALRVVARQAGKALAAVKRLEAEGNGTEGQDRESYTDTQDRENYS